MLRKVRPFANNQYKDYMMRKPLMKQVKKMLAKWWEVLPSTGITRSQRYCEPLRHPSAPGLSLAGIRLIIPDHALGLPVLRTLSLCTCRRHYPGAADRRTRRSNLPIHISLPRNHYRVGLHIVLFEDCSAFTRVAACTLARSPKSRPLSEGFRHFVTSMPAPAASGWSGRRAGLAPAGKAPPCHGARGLRKFAPDFCAS